MNYLFYNWLFNVNLLNNESLRHVHCIGVGGIGVSALAEILIKRGFSVSGSDAMDSDRLRYLRTLGARIFVGHIGSQIGSADLVVYSSAIDSQNPELLEAIKAKLPIIKRGHLLANVMQFYYGIAISGTHGKTTTTALVSHILLKAGKDPTYFIGGIPLDCDSPVAIGASDIFVAEADESDASFLYLKPKMAVVTNIECDHMDTYEGSEEALCDSFLTFLNAIPNDGIAVLCLDDQNIQQLKRQLTCPAVFYGINQQADYVITEYRQDELIGHAYIRTPTETIVVELALPGLHNMKNAVAALILALRLGVDQATIVNALKTFKGVGRRFQSHGAVLLNDKWATVYEDYGHHPTEVRETYRAAKLAFPQKRVVLIFQPHRFTRTRDLMAEFIDVLSQVDYLILLPTYGASEPEILEANSSALNAAICKTGLTPFYLEDTTRLYELLETIAQEDDVLMFQGAGDVGKLAKGLMDTVLTNTRIQE